MSEEQSFDPLNDEMSKLDDLRAKLEELVSKREPSPSEASPDTKSPFKSSDKPDRVVSPEKISLALQAKLEARIKTIENSLGELQSRMDDSVFHSFAESFKAKMHILEQRLNIDEKIKTIRKEVGSATNEVISGIENKITNKVYNLETKFAALTEQNKKIASTLEDGAEERLREHERNSKELLLRTKDLVASFQKRLEGEIESIRREMGDTTTKSGGLVKTLEGQVSIQFGELEKKMDEITNHSIAGMAKLEGELESRINQLESKNRELAGKAWEPLTGLEEKFSTDLRAVKHEVENLQAQNKEDKQNAEIKIDLKLGRLERQMDEIGRQSNDTISRIRGEMDSRYSQFEVKTKELLSKSLDAISQLESRLGTEVGRLRQEFIDEHAKRAEVVRSLETLEKNYREILETSRTTISNLDGKVDREIGSLRNTVEGVIPKISDTLKNSQIELNNKVYDLEQKVGVFTGKVGEITAAIQGDLESKQNQFEAKYKEIISRTAQSITGLQVSIETDIHKMHEEFRDLSVKVNHAEQYVKTETREKILSDTAWQQLTSKMATAMTDVDVKMGQSVSDMQQNQIKFLERKLRKSVIAFSIVSAILFVGIYLSVVGQTKGFLQSISNTFTGENGKSVLINAALSKLPEVLNESARPVLDLIKQDANKRVTEFQSYLEEQKSKIGDDQLMLSSEIVFLEERNRLTQLEDQAIQQGSRKALEDLQSYISVASQPQLAQTAKAGIERIKSFYAADSRIQKISLVFKGPSDFEYKDEAIPVTALFAYVRQDPDWKTRAKAADLLRTWKKQGVPEVLLEASKGDTNLYVVRAALRSFETVTGFRGDDVFSVAAAQTWWDQNKAVVNKHLSTN